MNSAAANQAVIVTFQHSGSWNDFFKWEPEIESAVKAAGFDYDGNELAVKGTDGTIYMYGSDADKLLAVALPHLRKATFLTHMIATLRYGDVSNSKAREVKVPITS